MTETFNLYLADYGVALLFFITFFSCLAVPVPSSLLMLTAGAFVATGDLQPSSVMVGALLGAVAGDTVGYLIGGKAREPIYRFMNGHPKREKLLSKAEGILQKRGMVGVYLSRWLFSPLGPYVNFTAGATAMHWVPFVIAGALGEVTWVSIYVGLGYGFADNLTMAADLASNVLGILAGISVMLATGAWLYHNQRKQMQLRNG